jgi:hypothetical protein
MSTEQQVPEWADPAVPVETLGPQGVSRRNLIRGAGLLGAGFAATAASTSVASAASTSSRESSAGDPVDVQG